MLHSCHGAETSLLAEKQQPAGPRKRLRYHFSRCCRRAPDFPPLHKCPVSSTNIFHTSSHSFPTVPAPLPRHPLQPSPFYTPHQSSSVAGQSGCESIGALCWLVAWREINGDGKLRHSLWINWRRMLVQSTNKGGCVHANPVGLGCNGCLSRWKTLFSCTLKPV